MNSAAADDGTTDGAREKFRQSHPHRHDVTLSLNDGVTAALGLSQYEVAMLQNAKQTLKRNDVNRDNDFNFVFCATVAAPLLVNVPIGDDARRCPPACSA